MAMKSLDEWNKALKDIDDDDDGDQLAERVKRGAEVSPHLSASGSGGGGGNVGMFPESDVTKLAEELHQSIGSLSIEEAKEAVKQAEAKMKNNLPSNYAKIATSQPSDQKKKSKSKSKTQKVISPLPPPLASKNSELEKIQREMKEMMDALAKVTAAAESAREEAAIRAKLVSERQQEVDRAQKHSEEEKAKMEDSFQQMSSSLQEEALKNKDNLVNEINSHMSSDEKEAMGIKKEVILTCEISETLSTTSKEIDKKKKKIDQFKEHGKLVARYNFSAPSSIKSGGAGVEEEIVSAALAAAASVKEGLNKAVDGDYIAAYALPKQKKYQQLPSADTLGEKDCDMMQPLDIANYLDFNYVDESAPNWEKFGVVEVTIGKKNRDDEAFLLCYISDDVCLASCLVRPHFIEQNSSSSSSSSPLISEPVVEDDSNGQIKQNKEESRHQIDSSLERSNTATSFTTTDATTLLTPSIPSSYSEKEEKQHLREVTGRNAEFSLTIEDLNSICCYKISIPLTSLNEAEKSKMQESIQMFMSALPSSSSPLRGRNSGVKSSTPDDDVVDSGEEADGSTKQALVSIPSIGFECSETSMTFKHPLLSFLSMETSDDGTRNSSSLVNETIQSMLELDVTHKKIQFKIASISMLMYENSQLVIRLPYEKKTINNTDTFQEHSSDMKGFSPSSTSSQNQNTLGLNAANLAKHEARIEARKQARIRKSKHARKRFMQSMTEGQDVSMKVGDVIAHEQTDKMGVSPSDKMGGTDHGKTETSEKVEDDMEDVSKFNLSTEEFRCAFCDATLIEQGSITKCSPAPVGLLDNICDDLMCSACPVIDLSSQGVMPSEKQCLYTNQAVLFQPSAIKQKALMAEKQLFLWPNETSCDTGSTNENDISKMKCARCLVTVGEKFSCPSGIILKSSDDSNLNDEIKVIGVRLYRHRICYKQKDGGLSSLSSSQQLLCNPTHNADTYVSALLIGAARKSNLFRCTLQRRKLDTLSLNENHQNFDKCATDEGGLSSTSHKPVLVQTIQVQLLSWTSLFASIRVNSQTANKNVKKFEEEVSLDVSEKEKETTRVCNRIDLLALLSPVLKLSFSTSTSGVDITSGGVTGGGSSGGKGEEEEEEGEEALYLDHDEFDHVLEKLEQNSTLLGLTSSVKSTSEKDQHYSKLSFLKLAHDFE